MAAERSTKAQVQAYRFGVRRVEHAVQTGVAYRRSLHGPRQGLATIIGLVAASLVLAGFAVYGFIKPAPSIGDAKVLVDTDSGGAFVVRDGVLHPALNLASAMLAAGDRSGGSAVRQVNTSTLGELPRGQLLGIPGAPNQVPLPEALVSSTWSVCDLLSPDPAAAPGTRTTPTTTVVIGMPQTSGPETATAVLATPDESTYYLLFDGHRALVSDIHDRALDEAFGLHQAAARPISVSLLNAIPEAPTIRVPTIAAQGRATTVGGHSVSVGDIVRVDRLSGGTAYFVALKDGIQEVPPAVADLIRATTGQPADVLVVTPSDLADTPTASAPLDLAAYPTHRPKLNPADRAPALCLDWQVTDGVAQRRIRPAVDLPLPRGAVAVPAPPGQPSAATGSADAVYLPPGHGLVVGQSSDGVNPNVGNLFLITDQGISYPVVDQAALESLGLGATISPAPPELLSLLPLGPTLSPTAARRYFDEQPHGSD